ncbi:tryptophanase [Rhodoplanes sp. TEM]|uniref:Tryptophanase n=1 Tax=Rhodoplanes tepidamans TaxID=200616 RepID=A0ABT5JFH8_RHOTP|nr:MULTISPECIES: tryptophanase [Rhodoplanes]MDC7788454.1 tryptophanase [Rhodoplanes tepidamans]MDC7983599.1 tryptophanase [Rhodoplanes sp. TEM]MDQ0354159.1 tryptophanase [Rhodoplanes tepidamans]
MSKIKYYGGETIPLEMHKVRIVQKLALPPIERRLEVMTKAGNNTFLLPNEEVFLDMLTDSGVNAMSDRQLAAMMVADDAYAGSATYTRLETKLREIFGMEYFLPAHQGRACEHILAKVLVTPGSVVPMNYHFTTTKAHITLQGGVVEELVSDAGLEVVSTLPFKGDMDIGKLKAVIARYGADKVAFVRVESGTNLIGGQPVSLANLAEVSAVCRAHGIVLVLDASLLADNLHFNKTREASCRDLTIREITRRIADLCDIIYFSARKLGCARGGGICIRDKDLYLRMRGLVPLFEGFLTYGGMSVREIEAITVGLEETMDEDMIDQGPQFIAYMVDELERRGVPVITPAGGLGCHVDAKRFVDHIPQSQYPAGALASALYIAGGIRGMERGTLSEQREPDGREVFSNMELVRLAMPRRVFTLSQVKYAVDRLSWLHENRRLVEGLVFVEEPEVLRFFYGLLKPVSDWQQRLVAKFRADFGDSL